MAAKKIVIPSGTPFLPLAQARLPSKPIPTAQAASRFRALQRVENGEPVASTRKSPFTLREMYQKFEDLYAQYPPASPEIVEAHRRLGYPEHFVNALETGDYKMMIDPIVKPNGEKDWGPLKDFWSFDWTQKMNVEAREAWDRIRTFAGEEFKAGRGFRFVPIVDLDALHSATRFLPDAAASTRSFLTKQQSSELVVEPAVLDSVWADYSAASEDSIADALYELYVEKQVEVKYVRRSALVQWMLARGDIDHWDLMDMMPKVRDNTTARYDETGLILAKLTMPAVEESTGKTLQSWDDYKEMLREQHVDWFEKDEHAALGGAVTEAAELQRRIEQIVNRGKDDAADAKAADVASGKKATRGVTALEIVNNRDAIEKKFIHQMSSDVSRLPVLVQSFVQTTLGNDYVAKWKQAKDEFDAKYREQQSVAQ